MGGKTVAVILLVTAIVAGGIFLIPMALASGGGGGGQTVTIATMVGTLQGSGYDTGFGVSHAITSWSWPQGQPYFTNYHIQTFSDSLSTAWINFLTAIGLQPQGNIGLSAGNVQETLTVTDTTTGQVIYTHTWTDPTTSSFSISHPVVVPGMIQGRTYSLQAKDWWGDISPTWTITP